MCRLVGGVVVGEDHLVGAIKAEAASPSPLGVVPEYGLKIIIKSILGNKI